ncbi:aminotransferase class III-fold pyridoxal phosphate-dependent enzyme [Pseudoxanthobacter sp. M-2]|uniref:aminotransferase class III-fold pyridoxal phosphate-dependent enzyme n=1 Tax=Pseudoxanthobacter sp. M-2 TaxID=3078754 RepID=UPI0038FD186B
MNQPFATQDAQLRARAGRVIPGGLWGHQNAARLPAGYPQYFSHGQGCRIWDVDGREYIDFMGGWGPVVLGWHDPEVDAAAAKQAALGDCLNGPSERLVELAELVVDTIPHADWAMFSKNGTDASTQCVMIARSGTGRRKILVGTGAYHGAAPWCTPWPGGTTAEDRAHQIFFEWNNIESLERAVTEAGDDLAAILLSAFKYDLGKDHVMPTVEFARACRAAADRTGAALIVDDVRAGFRIDIGGTWEAVGVQPDLSAWSKAIANGHALGAVTGNDRFREGATKVFTTGSFWTAGVAMAAAIATIGKLKRDDGVGHMKAMGERFRAGLDAQAKAHGLPIRQSGPAQMPVVLFDDDADRRIGNAFCLEALQRGVYLHPTHTMFLSVAHTPADIDAALDRTDAAMAAVKKAVA